MEIWKEAYLQLQNGSDVRGVALEGTEGEEVNLTEDIVRDIAMAFAEYLAERGTGGELRVGVGNDSRLSAQELKRGVVNGLGRRGFNVYE